MGDLLEDWPISNNFILAAILLLIASAFTLAFSTESQANRYATWAYYALVIGVGLRFVEIILEERKGIELKSWVYSKFNMTRYSSDSEDSGKFECDKCGKEFDSEHGLNVHRGQVH